MEKKSVWLVSLLDRFSIQNNEIYNLENKINKLKSKRDKINDIPIGPNIFIYFDYK
jgi:hypothetical protein